MNDRFRDIVRRPYERLGRDHARQRAKLMASIPHAVPATDNTRTITERIFKMNRTPRIGRRGRRGGRSAAHARQ